MTSRSALPLFWLAVLAAGFWNLSALADELGPAAANRLRDQWQARLLAGQTLVQTLRTPDILPPKPEANAALPMVRIKPYRGVAGHAFLDREGALIVLPSLISCRSNLPVSIKTTDLALPSEGCLTAAADRLMGILAPILMASEDNGVDCEVFTTHPGPPLIRIGDCFWRERGRTLSLSRAMLASGWAFIERDAALQPVSDELARIEAFARNARAGLWADFDQFPHPYGQAAKRAPAP